MGYFRHLLACNAWDPRHFKPFIAAGRRIGWLRHDHIRLLRDFPEIFEIGEDAVVLASRLASAEERSQAIERVGRVLAARGDAAPFRDELFSAAPDWGEAPCFELDRGLVPFFGIKGYGVHLNGYFHDRAGLGMWIGHRSATKKVDPLKLDNVVAGGISAGHDVWETLLKEGAEEAAMTPELLRGAHAVGTIRYRLEVAEGMRDDALFVYDLEIPDDFTPRNTDGEFDFFERMPVSRCLELVASTDRFKFNVNLTVIDFALRHGLIAPDHPEYAMLGGALRGDLIRHP